MKGRSGLQGTGGSTPDYMSTIIALELAASKYHSPRGLTGTRGLLGTQQVLVLTSAYPQPVGGRYVPSYHY